MEPAHGVNTGQFGHAPMLPLLQKLSRGPRPPSTMSSDYLSNKPRLAEGTRTEFPKLISTSVLSSLIHTPDSCKTVFLSGPTVPRQPANHAPSATMAPLGLAHLLLPCEITSGLNFFFFLNKNPLTALWLN